MRAAVANSVLSSTPKRKDFPISRLFSLLHCRAHRYKRNIYFGPDKEQVLIISSMPNFPPIEGGKGKKKKSRLRWTLDEQEYGFTKYLATSSQ